jgi:7,8-dihydropterin-6-yl-methyl-4-(beta-D-ribofuranosyl)aminobenzene 5'-phosphate synthase
MGQTNLFLENAKNLNINLEKVDFAVLSHGHYDHGGGLSRFMQINDKAPVYVNRNAFQPHYNGTGKFIGLEYDGLDVSRIRFVDDEHKIAEGISLCTCNGKRAVAEVDSFGQTVEEKGLLQPDHYRHEQYLVINENGRKFCFSGCSHKGILNIIHWLQPDVLFGGFHFMKVPVTGEGMKLLKDSAKALLSGETRYYTGHCTGLEQYEVMKTVMGDRLQLLSCGVEIEL